MREFRQILRHRLFLRSACALVAIGASLLTTRADVAYLRNGNTIDISGFKVLEGSVLLTLAGGGEMALPTGEVLEIRRMPSSEPPVAPQPPPPPDGAPAASAPPPAVTEPARPSGSAEVLPADPGPISGLPAGGVFDRKTLREMAGRIARQHGVDEALVHAVIQIESRFDAFAVSPRGAMGLMQLMPKTAARFEVVNAFDPVENVDGGVRYLKELLERYSGQPRLALAAYNAGEEAVERYGGIPPYRETIEYVRRIQGLLAK